MLYYFIKDKRQRARAVATGVYRYIHAYPPNLAR